MPTIRCSEAHHTPCRNFVRVKPGVKSARCRQCRELSARLKLMRDSERHGARPDDENAAIYESLLMARVGR
jgi:hypothetical protein